MVSGAFDTLLEELGKALNINGLVLDQNGTCLISFPNGLEVHVEPSNRGEEEVLLYAKLGQLPPGRYRDDVLREALKANSFPFPRYGTFAFTVKNGQLVLFDNLPTKNLRGESLADYLNLYMKKALAWKEQIDTGRIPVAATIENTGPTGQSRGFFGGLIR